MCTPCADLRTVDVLRAHLSSKLSLTKETGELVPVGVSGVGIYSRGESVPREGVSRE